jgi:hypothetical protein
VNSYQHVTGVNVMDDVPSRSLDINIIKHAWPWTESQLGKKEHNPIEDF